MPKDLTKTSHYRNLKAAIRTTAGRPSEKHLWDYRKGRFLAWREVDVENAPITLHVTDTASAYARPTPENQFAVIERYGEGDFTLRFTFPEGGDIEHKTHNLMRSYANALLALVKLPNYKFVTRKGELKIRNTISGKNFDYYPDFLLYLTDTVFKDEG